MLENAEELVNEALEGLDPGNAEAALGWLAARFGSKAAFSSSLGLEDQVITHLIWTNHLPIQVFTLDTGRLFPETYSLMETMAEKYGRRIRVYFPDQEEVERLVSEKGPNCFYESVENRKACCGIRKVDPLARALEGMSCWVTGIRAAQSGDRSALPVAEWDPVHGLVKCHPLLRWTAQDIRSFIALHQVPYNPLHDRGFESIGCAPCTRAIRPGEDQRAGRWWWENNEGKECGLHVHPAKQLNA